MKVINNELQLEEYDHRIEIVAHANGGERTLFKTEQMVTEW